MLLRNIRQTQDRQRRKRQPTSMRGRSEMNWKEDRAAYYAGQIRTELGERLDLIEKNSFKFCYINDFPMSGTAQDLMYGAPSKITEQQLREVHIKVRD